MYSTNTFVVKIDNQWNSLVLFYYNIYYIILYYILLYCIVLYCITLYYIILYYNYIIITLSSTVDSDNKQVFANAKSDQR